MFTSLKRCKDSAAILFPRNNLITIEDFKEYNSGEFEGKTAAELQDNLTFRNHQVYKLAVRRDQRPVYAPGVRRF